MEVIRFNVLRNAIYHTARRRQFEWWNRFFNFIVVALGAAAIADLTTSLGISQMAIGAAVAIVGTLQLVMDFGGSARTHQTLQRDYHQLLAEIEEAETPDDAKRRQWDGKMIRIAGDEPPVLRALDAKAYNDAIDATEDGGFDRSERLHIGLWPTLLGSFLQFNGTDFKKVSEIEAAAVERKRGRIVQPAE
ncbi:hypothetical protein ATO4_04220 [Aurantimonas sp. 22II-16-19i]|nr:hypothetical protein ATO4_04220 [Aurantimonas sp. 22II-16-19i]